MEIALIALIFCFGFFIESIVGFGGTLVAFAILGYFLDIKDLILLGLYIATTASIYVVASDYKSLQKEIFLKSLPYCLIGTILGIILFVYLSSAVLLKVFAIFLIILSLKTFFFDKIKFHKILLNKLLIVGGLNHGLFGIGGPFFVAVLKNQFKCKSELRATMAVFFISFNAVRYIQLALTGNFNNELFLQFWWIPLPLAVAIYLGHKIHLKISEKFFKHAIASLTLISGISFLF